MKTLIVVVMLWPVLLSGALAADAYPRSAELVAAQTELDSRRGVVPRNQMDAEAQKRLDLALSARDAELNKRNAEWKREDSVSMLKAQTETCSAIRQGLREKRKSTEFFENLRYAGFTTDETLDIVLQIDTGTPEIGKGVRVAFCILGLPDKAVRSKTKSSETVMFVYPKIFVHAEDGVVTAWSER